MNEQTVLKATIFYNSGASLVVVSVISLLFGIIYLFILKYDLFWNLTYNLTCNYKISINRVYEFWRKYIFN